MATIPEVPPEQKIVPIDGGRRQQIPTYDNGSVTPENTFTTPFIAGEKTAQLVGNIADQFNKAADKTALEDGAKMGYLEQQRNIEEGNREYIGGGSAFSISAQAYQKGANVAYMMRKKADYEIGLKELAEKRSNDTNRFNQESNELKKKILSDVPQSLIADISVDFDKNKLNFETQIVGIQRKQQYDQNVDDIKTGMYREIGKISGMLTAGGMQSEGLTDSFVNLQTSLESLREHFNLSPKDMREVSDELRKKLFGVYLKHEFEKVKTDPTARQKLKESLASGTYNFSELGDEYGQFIPGGKNISLREADAYGKIFEHYEKEYVQGLAGQLHIFDKGEKTKDDDALKGRNFSLDENGNLSFTNLEYDEVTARSLGMPETKIQQNKFDRAVNIAAGKYSHDAIMANITDLPRILEKINLDEQNAYKEKDQYKKSLFLAATQKAKTEVDTIYKERLEHETKGTYQDYWTEKVGPLYFSAGINLATAEGTQEWVNRFEKNGSNKPYLYSGLPSQQAIVELQTLKSAVTVEQLTSNMQQIIARQKEYASGYIAQGIKSMKGSEKEGDHAYFMLHEFTASGRTVERDQLAAAIIQRKNNMEALKAKGTLLDGGRGDTFTVEMKEARQTFFDTFGKQIDVSTAYGKAMIDSYESIYLKVRSSGITSSNDAQKIAKSFVKDTQVEIELDNGQKIMLPKSYAEDKNSSRAGDIQKLLNNVRNNPHEYNVLPAPGQTFDDLVRDKDNYTFVYDNGHFVMKNKKNDLAANVFMKLPSDHKTLIYSDAVIGIDKGNKQQTTFSDVEGTWRYDSKFSKTLPENPKNLDSYVRSLQKQFVQDHVGYNEQTKRASYKYNDWMVAPLIGFGDSKQQIAQAISLKAKENNLNDKDLEWLGQNTTYLSALNSKTVRKAVLDEYKKNYDNYRETTSKNYAATVMSPLQVIATVTKTNESKVGIRGSRYRVNPKRLD